MYKIKTNKPFQILNNRYEVVANTEIFMFISDLIVNKSSFTAKGYYFYIVIETVEEIDYEKIIILEKINSTFEMNETKLIESNYLQPFTFDFLIDATLLRLSQFSQLKIQQESGENFNTLFEDWDFTNLDT